MKKLCIIALSLLLVIGMSTIAYAAVTNLDSLTLSADLVVDDDATITDDLTVTGLATVGETLGVTGISTFTGAATVTGGIVAVPIITGDHTTITITAANSGKIHVIADLSQDSTIALPTAADGLNYRFVYAGVAQDASDITIDTGADANFFLGGCVDFDDDDGTFGVVYPDGNSNSIVKIDTINAGTDISLVCDGTNWYLSGQIVSGTDTGSAFSDQS